MYSITPTDISNFESYLVQSDKNINTIKKYVRDIMKFRTFLLDKHKEFTQAATDEYLQSLIDAGYETRSVNSVIAGIKSFCKFLGRTDIYCKSLKIRKKNNQESKLRLTPEEYKRLIDTALERQDYRMVQLIQVLGGTELRISELNDLTVEAVKDGVVTVLRAGEEYDIYLPETLLEGLEGYIDHLGLQTGGIFRTSNGNVIDRGYIWRQMKLLAERAGVDQEKVYPQNLKRQLIRQYYTISYPDNRER